MKTFREFCAQFYTAYPGGQVLGYNDLIGDSRLGPGFSVDEYVKDNFEKTILIDTLMNSSSLSPLQIIEKSKGTTIVSRKVSIATVSRTPKVCSRPPTTTI